VTVQDVDVETYYAIGRGLFAKAGKLYDAFNANVTILGGTGSMAGTDDAGKAWATSYDERVNEVLGAVNDLSKAMENYGGVVIQAGYNHAVAEYNATPGSPGPAPTKPPEPASSAGVLTAPPSAGGPGRGLVDAIGLMQQVGVPVPDGDTDKVSTAADAWDRLATVYQVKTIAEGLEVDARIFRDAHSPEVDFLVRDLEELRDAMTSVTDGCAELSQSCKDYKAALDDLRTQLEGILEDLAIELAATAAIAIAASFVSFGASAVAGTAKAAHSIRKFAAIITEAVGAWKISKNIATGVKKAKDIAGLRAKLQLFINMGKKGKGPQLGPGVKQAAETPLTATRAQIESKFKHAQDFGVTEPRGKSGFDAFEDAIAAQLKDPNTMHISGTYRGNPAILNYNPSTGTVVVQSPTGEFISGWKVSPAQATNIVNSGKLGGG
jgi:hypothetical protein